MAPPTKITNIAADQPFAEAGAAVVEARASDLLEHCARVLDTDDIEGVHATRVATRRLRAALEVFATCFPRGPYKRLLKQVKALADALGERRDRDVEIEGLSRFVASIPPADRDGIESLIERLRTEQRRANQKLAPFVDRERLEGLQAAAIALAEQARDAIEPEVQGERGP
jgi:CHAD domain-containing protein